MCLRFVFLLITRMTTWLRLSRREEAWQTAEILILRHQLAVLQRRQPLSDRGPGSSSQVPGAGHECAPGQKGQLQGRSPAPPKARRSAARLFAEVRVLG